MSAAGSVIALSAAISAAAWRSKAVTSVRTALTRSRPVPHHHKQMSRACCPLPVAAGHSPIRDRQRAYAYPLLYFKFNNIRTGLENAVWFSLLASFFLFFSYGLEQSGSRLGQRQISFLPCCGQRCCHLIASLWRPGRPGSFPPAPDAAAG